MSRRERKNYLYKEEDLLTDLNKIVDYVIGNESPEEVSFNERATLPESLAYAMMNPDNLKAQTEVLQKMRELEKRVKTLHDKLIIMKKRVELKRQPSLYDEMWSKYKK